MTPMTPDPAGPEPKQHKTVVVENARLELLRHLLEWRDKLAPLLRQQHPDMACDWVPLSAGYLFPEKSCGPRVKPSERIYENEWDDIVLAAKEAAAIGQIELFGPGKSDAAGVLYPHDWTVKITQAGADWIAAHDAAGESAHV